MNIAPLLRRGLPVASISLICIRTASTVVQKGSPGGRDDHGEKIWVFTHMTSNQVIYSLKPVLDFNKAMRQLPFNGKKTRPAKLRKDYWHPMAVICFRKNFGRGVIGCSAFQKLREYRRLHELSWGDELLRCTKQQRGFKINDQRANSIADMAAVLSGRGLGNLVAEAKARPAIPWHASKKEEKTRAESKRLYKATIFWADRNDRKYAREWTGNVNHETMKVVLGTQYWFDPEPDRPGLVVVQPEPEPPAEGKEAAEGGVEKDAEEAAGEEAVEEAVEAAETKTEKKPRRPRRDATPAKTQAKPVKTEAGAETPTTAKPEADAEDAETEATESESESTEESTEESKEASTDPDAAINPAEEEDPDADLWSPEDGTSDDVDKAYEQKELLRLEQKNKTQEPGTPAEGEAAEGKAAEGQATEGQAAKEQAAEPKTASDAEADSKADATKAEDPKSEDSKKKGNDSL